MATATLKLLVLKTSDVERMRGFYDLLGVEFVPERHGNGPLHYAGTVGNAVFELYPLPSGASAVAAMPRLGKHALAELARSRAALECLMKPA